MKNGRCYSDALTFEFHRLRFRFTAQAALYFPPYKSANIVRGAFGSVFRGLVCDPRCSDAKSCDQRHGCPYARIFEPAAARNDGPSGLADWPRPFVFRASHLDGITVRARDSFHFDVHLFDTRNPVAGYFVRTFTQLGVAGLGPGRVRADLQSVEQLDVDGASIKHIPAGTFAEAEDLAHPIAIDVNGVPELRDKLRVRFVTPTELKGDHGLVARPEFPILFSRLRDRISTLRMLYGAGPLDIDFRGMAERAATIQLTLCNLDYIDAERVSSRTGQRHSLGGFVGDAEYSGDVAEFLPYLQLGRWLGVGRQTVWGKGEVHLLTS